jgi:N-acetyl sugar amidotransferase
MTNQKPFSINETKNKVGSEKTGLHINAKGLCAACNYTKSKNISIDWEHREKLLIETLSRYKKKNGKYDCIVSGSGGKDSVTIAHLLKYKYGMNPLTVTYSPLLYTDIGWKNLRSWINVGGFDNILFSPNGKVSGILARESFQNLLHPMQPFKFGIKSFAIKMALIHDIDLVMFGEPYAEYGSESVDSVDSPSYSAEWYVNDSPDMYIGGTHFDMLKDKYNLSDIDLHPYKPLKSEEVVNNVNVEFLGWYLKWNPQEIYYYASQHCGYEPDVQRTDGTYGRYSGIDDKFDWLHFYCQYIKFGIGRCRFDVSQEIRSGHITREEGILLAKKYEGEIPKRYIKDCLNFMGLSEHEGQAIIDKFRSPHLWEFKNKSWSRLQELPDLK